MGIVADFAHLFVKIELDIVDIVDVVLMEIDEVVDFGFVIDGIVAPFRHVGCSVYVAQHAEGRIGCKPRFIFLKKGLEFVGCEDSLTVLGEQFAGKFVFSVVDAFIVNLRESVELTSEVIEVVLAFLVVK